MTERSIVDAATRLRRTGEPYLVATIVNVHGASSRRVGAKMILTRFRWLAGSVGGSCLPGDVASQAWALTKDGAPAIVSYSAAHLPGGPDDDDLRAAIGLGGDTTVDVLFERTGMPGRIDPLELAARCLRAQRRGAIATVTRSATATVPIGSRLALVAGGAVERQGSVIENHDLDPAIVEVVAGALRDALATGAPSRLGHATPDGPIEVLIEVVIPPPRLFVFGTSHDAVPLAQLACNVGWDVVVCATDPKYSTRERFRMADEVLVGPADAIRARIDESDRAIVMIMSHDDVRDRENLAMVLASRARYISVLGPRARTTKLLAELGRADDARIHASDDLPIRGESAQEIALGIVAGAHAMMRHEACANPRIAAPEPMVFAAAAVTAA